MYTPVLAGTQQCRWGRFCYAAHACAGAQRAAGACAQSESDRHRLRLQGGSWKAPGPEESKTPLSTSCSR